MAVYLGGAISGGALGEEEGYAAPVDMAPPGNVVTPTFFQSIGYVQINLHSSYQLHNYSGIFTSTGRSSVAFRSRPASPTRFASSGAAYTHLGSAIAAPTQWTASGASTAFFLPGAPTRYTIRGVSSAAFSTNKNVAALALLHGTSVSSFLSHSLVHTALFSISSSSAAFQGRRLSYGKATLSGQSAVGWTGRSIAQGRMSLSGASTVLATSGYKVKTTAHLSGTSSAGFASRSSFRAAWTIPGASSVAFQSHYILTVSTSVFSISSSKAVFGSGHKVSASFATSGRGGCIFIGSRIISTTIVVDGSAVTAFNGGAWARGRLSTTNTSSVAFTSKAQVAATFGIKAGTGHIAFATPATLIRPATMMLTGNGQLFFSSAARRGVFFFILGQSRFTASSVNIPPLTLKSGNVTTLALDIRSIQLETSP